MKYKHEIYDTETRAKCPMCGTETEMFYLNEQREYINPVTTEISYTRNKCKTYELACFDCLSTIITRRERLL